MRMQKNKNEGDGSRISDWDENGSSGTKTRDRVERKSDESARAKPDGEDTKGKFQISKKTLVISGICFGALLIGVFLYWLHSRNFVSTDDAYTTTHVHEISARVAGTVQSVNVDDNQLVKAGPLWLRSINRTSRPLRIRHTLRSYNVDRLPIRPERISITPKVIMIESLNSATKKLSLNKTWTTLLRH